MNQRWVACIITKEGLRLYAKGVTPKRTTTADIDAACTFPTQDHAMRIAQMLCPDGGRYTAKAANE